MGDQPRGDGEGVYPADTLVPFASIGLVIARMSGKDSLSFYENGVVSIDPPLAGDVVGGRASRTTHPKALRGLEALFSTLLDRSIQIRNPLQWLTKKEVTLRISRRRHGGLFLDDEQLYEAANLDQEQKHCGLCSQCIDRRFAVLAAGMDEHDPAENYMRDLLLADRSADGDMRMALIYVSFFQRVGATSKERFLVDFPEVVSALNRYSGLSPDEAGDRIYDLFQRHARAVEAVISDGVAKHARALYRNELPAGSLLAICFSRGHVEAAPASDYDAQTKAFIDRLSAPVLEFAIDRGGKRVLFRGRRALDGANFRVVEALSKTFGNPRRRTRKFRSCRPRAWRSLRVMIDQCVSNCGGFGKRLSRWLSALGFLFDQDTFIETKERAGYRLNPELKEVCAWPTSRTTTRCCRVSEPDVTARCTERHPPRPQSPGNSGLFAPARHKKDQP